MTCSIIIRAFNEEKHIKRLLEGIQKQTSSVDIEIILVDSGSTDNTVNIAKNYKAKIINIKPEEFSFGRALNRGCEAATGEFLIFASAHVYPLYTDWINRILKPFNDPKIALVYGRQIGDKNSKYSEKQLFKKWFPEISNFNQSHPFCNNANAAIRKSLWLELPYDESLTGLEDLDWANKILKSGYNVAYDAKATIVHVHEETPKKIFNRYYREAIAIKNIFPNQKFSFFDFIWLTMSHIAIDYGFAIKEQVFLNNIFEVPLFRVLQFWGTYKGHRINHSISYTLKKRFYYPKNFLFKPNTSEEVQELIEY
jgi:glycosyltransferase involved in cell wall biosynthesis